MLMLSMPFVDDDDDDDLLLLYRHHLSILCNNLFFFTLDSEFMNFEPDQVIPQFALANCNRTLDLLEDGWCYHHTCCFTVAQLCELYLRLQLPVTFTISTVGHKASSEEAFIIAVTKLATSRTNTS
jgi:hypothetical protein